MSIVRFLIKPYSGQVNLEYERPINPKTSISKKFEEICARALAIETVANGVKDIQAASGSSNTNWVAKRKSRPTRYGEAKSNALPDLRKKFSSARDIYVCYSMSASKDGNDS